MATKLIPRFGGKEVYWWLMQAEEYFRIRRHEEGKLWWTVAFALRGEALDWWVSWKDNNPNPTWGKFTEAILKQFRSEIDSIEKQERRLVGKSRKVSRNGGKKVENMTVTNIKKEQETGGLGSTNQGVKKRATQIKQAKKTFVLGCSKVKAKVKNHEGKEEIGGGQQERKVKKTKLTVKEEPLEVNLIGREDGSKVEKRKGTFCMLAALPPPKPPDKGNRTVAVTTREEEEKEGNSEETTSEKGHATAMELDVSSSPVKTPPLPELPDANQTGEENGSSAPAPSNVVRRAEAEVTLTVKSQMAISTRTRCTTSDREKGRSSTTHFQSLGQFVTLISRAILLLDGSKPNKKLIVALVFDVGTFQQLFNSSNEIGASHLFQWDPGGSFVAISNYRIARVWASAASVF